MGRNEAIGILGKSTIRSATDSVAFQPFGFDGIRAFQTKKRLIHMGANFTPPDTISNYPQETFHAWIPDFFNYSIGRQFLSAGIGATGNCLFAFSFCRSEPFVCGKLKLSLIHI